MKINEVVAAYVALRDAKAEQERRHEEELKPIKEAMRDAEAAMLGYMNESGVMSVRTPSGTVLKSKRVSVTVGDWDASWGFITENQFWHFLEHRLNKSAVEAYIAETGQIPPGANVVTEYTAQFRRS